MEVLFRAQFSTRFQLSDKAFLIKKYKAAKTPDNDKISVKSTLVSNH